MSSPGSEIQHRTKPPLLGQYSRVYADEGWVGVEEGREEEGCVMNAHMYTEQNSGTLGSTYHWEDRYMVITVRLGDAGVYFKYYFSFFLQQGFLCNFENNKY